MNMSIERWWNFPSLTIFLVSSLSFFPLVAYGCEALLGTYATSEDGEPIVRIEKQGKSFVARKDTGWQRAIGWERATVEKLHPIPRNKLAETVGAEIEIDKDSCGLAGHAKIFLKLRKGAKYTINSSTGASYNIMTGYLIGVASGFGGGTIELHRVDPLEWTAKPLHILTGHTGYIFSVDIFGKHIVSLATDSTIRIWDIDSGALLNTLQEPSPFDLIATDGKRIALVSKDQAIYILDPTNKTLLKPLHGHNGFANAVAINGNRMALASNDKTIRIWDIASGAILHTLQIPTTRVSRLAITEKRVISSISPDHTILIWDIDSGVLLHTLRGHTAEILSISIVGNRIVSRSYDHTIRIWDVNSGILLHTLLGHTDSVFSFSILGNRIVSGSKDRTVRIWDIDSGILLHTLLGHTDSVYFVSIVGNRIVSVSDRSICIWDAENGALLETLRHHSPIFSVATDGNRIVSGLVDEIRVWKMPGERRDKRKLQPAANTR